MKMKFFSIFFVFLVPVLGQDSVKPEQDYPNLKEIVVVYKTHFDIGYSDLARNVVHKYRTEMLDHALDNIEKNSRSPKDEQFVWTIPGWPMKQILWEGQTPERKMAIEKAIKSGNLSVHALPFTTHTEINELEDMVRGLGDASSIARKYGLELPRAAKMTDVPCHVWALPTILHHAGVEFFHFGCNLTNRMPLVPTLFWWEGPDGSRLLTMASQGYGTSPLPPKGWPYSTWLYINQTGDNEGPPSPETVRRNLDYYKKNLPGIKVKIGKLSDFSDAILSSKADIPVVRGDMPDTWVHGPMCSPNAVALSRTAKLEIGTAETMQNQEKLWGIYLPDETNTYRDAYEQSLLFGEHTWGFAAQHYRQNPYGEKWKCTYEQGNTENNRKLEESWDEHDNYIRRAAGMLTGPLENQISALADNVSQPGKRIVVYNPLPWKRSATVTQNIVYWPTPKSIKPVDGDELIPVVVHGKGEGGKRGAIISFEARDVPPMGYRTFILDGKQESAEKNTLVSDEKERTIENAFFKVRFNPAEGRIDSLVDKGSNRELIDPEAPQGFGQYLYERYGKAEVMRFLNAYLYPRFMGSHGPITDKMDIPADSVYQSAVVKNTTFKIEQNPMEISAVMTGEMAGPGMPQSVSIRLTLYASQPWVDVKIGIRKSPDPWPEAGWICLPFKIDQPEYRLGRLGGIIDPRKDIIENCNFRMLWLNTGMTVSNNSGGIGICPLDSPLVSLGEPGCQHFDKSYVPRKPYVYINLYNNKWATNFREWWGGELFSTVRLWTFDKYDAESSLYTPSMNARVPLITARSSSKPGNLPVRQSGISLSRKGIQISTFSENTDGEGILLRLWEQAGISGPCAVTFPEEWKISAVQPVDLRGNKRGEVIPVKESKFTFDLKGFSPAGFLMIR